MEVDVCEAKCSTEDVLSSPASHLPIPASKEIAMQTDLNTAKIIKCFRSVKSQTDDYFLLETSQDAKKAENTK